MRTSGRGDGSSNPVLLLFGMIFLLLPVPFIWLHIVTPSDGARLSRGSQLFTDRGVIVSPYKMDAGLLQEGDVVLAVDGISIEAWSWGLISPGPKLTKRQVNQTVKYTVLRDGESMDLVVRLVKLPLLDILSAHWSIIFFFLVSQALMGFVYLRRPGDPAARALFLWAFIGSSAYAWSFFLQVSDLLNPVGFWLFQLSATGQWLFFWAASLYGSLVYPKPLLHLRHPRLWAVTLYFSPFIIFAIYLAWQWKTASNILVWWDRWGTGQNLIAVLYALSCLISMVLQYATSRLESERVKIR